MTCDPDNEWQTQICNQTNKSVRLSCMAENNAVLYSSAADTDVKGEEGEESCA